jgi:hypothetical protein
MLLDAGDMLRACLGRLQGVERLQPEQGRVSGVWGSGSFDSCVLLVPRTCEVCVELGGRRIGGYPSTETGTYDKGNLDRTSIRTVRSPPLNMGGDGERAGWINDCITGRRFERRSWESYWRGKSPCGTSRSPLSSA